MMVVTFQTVVKFKPFLSVHGDIVKIDLGALLMEMDKEYFLNLIGDLVTQAAEHQIYVRTLK